ncbi:MAG: hypothetical protein R3348_05070, partial [Xanthomonadales bacterium]|nr:hypothetical protein [Xanthomonadales bacterium]
MFARDRINDRFTVALLLALGLHAAVLLLLGFVYDINPLRKAAETLDVVLVNWRSESEPDDADFLAQAPQSGGGEHEETERLAQSPSSPLPSAEQPMPPDSAEPVEARVQEQQIQQVISQQEDARPIQQVSRVEQPEPSLDAAELLQQGRQLAR